MSTTYSGIGSAQHIAPMSSSSVNYPFVDAVAQSLPPDLRDCFQDLKDAYAVHASISSKLNSEGVLDHLIRFICGGEYNSYSARQKEEWVSGQEALKVALGRLIPSGDIPPSVSVSAVRVRKRKNDNPASNLINEEEKPSTSKKRRKVAATSISAPIPIPTPSPSLCQPLTTRAAASKLTTQNELGRAKLVNWVATTSTIHKDFLPWLPPCLPCQEAQKLSGQPTSECAGPVLDIADHESIIKLSRFRKCEACKRNYGVGKNRCTFMTRGTGGEPDDLRDMLVEYFKQLNDEEFLKICNEVQYISNA